MSNIAKIYEQHNANNRGRGFTILGEARKKIFANYLNNKSGLKICDIGTRDGTLTQDFMHNNEFWAVDFDQQALDYLANKFKVKTINQDLNAENWDLPKNYFDVVIFSEVLEHVYYPKVVLHKIADILKSDGVLLGTVPNAFSLKNRFRLFFANKKGTSLEDPTHINHFSYNELEKVLKIDFHEVELKPLIQKKYIWLSKLSPSLFSFMIFFKGKK